MALLFIRFFGSIALFLFGTKLLGQGLESTASARIRQALELFTRNRFTSFILGFLLTLILQFSSATVILAAGLTGSGILSLMQAGAMILGANLGTTIKAQFFLADPGFIMPLALMAGTALYLFTKERSRRDTAFIFLGLGLLLAGLELLQISVLDLSRGIDFELLFQSFGHTRVAALLTGFLITVMIQSSSGAVAVFVTMAAHGVIAPDMALPLIIGANIGTTITPLVAAAGAGREGRQAALMHPVFNILGALFISPFGGSLTELAGRLSGGGAPMQMAFIHILFNLIMAVIMLPLLQWIVRLSGLLVPGRRSFVELTPSYPGRSMAVPVSRAEDQARQLTLIMGSYARENVRLAVDAFLNLDPSLGRRLKHNENFINYLEIQITSLLVRLSSGDPEEPAHHRIKAGHYIIADIEKIGDLAHSILILAEEEVETGAEITHVGRDEFRTLYHVAIEAVNLALDALRELDQEAPGRVRELKEEILSLEKQFRDNHIGRLNRGDCSPGAGILFVDAMSELVRMAGHSVNIIETVRSMRPDEALL